MGFFICLFRFLSHQGKTTSGIRPDCVISKPFKRKKIHDLKKCSDHSKWKTISGKFTIQNHIHNMSQLLKYEYIIKTERNTWEFNSWMLTMDDCTSLCVF